MDLKEMGELLLECIDVPKFKKVLAIKVLVPILEQFVKNTENPYDDKAVEFFKSWVEKNLE